MKNSLFKKITFTCISMLVICSFINAQVINDDFEGGFPSGAYTGYVPGSGCHQNHVYWVDNVMNNVCQSFPAITGDGDFMTIDVGSTNPPGTVWERTDLDLSGCYTFSVDFVHRFSSPGNPNWPAAPVQLLLRSEGSSITDHTFITIDLNTSWDTFTEEIELPNGTTTLSLLNSTDACWNCDFGIDNIILECCEGGYYFDAYESDYEDCCIEVDAGSNGGCDNWHIEINGTAYYSGDENHFDNFIHCSDENDTYLVEFFVDDQLYWDTEVDLTTCEDCDDCNITPPEIVVAQDGCTVVLCTHGESNSCGTADYEWDMGDGNVYNDMTAIHDYSENGTYTACVTYTVTAPNGESCSEEVCEDIEITDCNEGCCDFTISNPLFSPFDPCVVYIPVSRPFCDHQIVYNTGGQSSNNGFITFNGPGPHTVCITITSDNCSLTQCITVSTPRCTIKELDDPRGGRPKLSNTDVANSILVYPNPSKDHFKLDLKILSESFLNIQLIDQSGRSVQNNEKQLAEGTHELNFDVADLPRGIYVVKVSSEHFNRSNKLLLID